MFWLIQRGEFKDLSKSYNDLTGRDGLVDLDYMGSAEFEFGSIPRSYRRIMGSINDYIYFPTDILDYKNDPLIIFCNKNHKDKIVAEIKRYLENRYRLKEYWPISDLISGKGYHLRSNFMWCIDFNNTGDWMGFFGEEKGKAFRYAIVKDYNDWWMQKSEKERKEEIEKSYK